MKKVLFLRHGESRSNLKGVFAGGNDNTPLTDKGRQQARQAGQELKATKIDRIISSPLDRTYETAKIVSHEVGYEISKIITDKRLKEYNIGSGRGEPVEGMTAAKMVAFAGAEDPEKFAIRVLESLRKVDQYSGTTLIVGHGGVARLIECLRTNQNPATFYDLPKHPNAHAVELDLSWLN